MSEILVNEIKHRNGTSAITINTSAQMTVRGEGGNATTNLQQGLAKAWINFNGTGTVAVRDSYNISSLTDNNTGLYTLSWSNSFANDDYSNAGMSGQQSSAMINVSCTIDDTAPTTSASQYNTMYENSGSGNFDSTQVTIQVYGDLA